MLGWLFCSWFSRGKYQRDINLLSTQLRNCKDKCADLENDSSKAELESYRNEVQQLRGSVSEQKETIAMLESQLKISQEAKKASTGGSLLERFDVDENRPTLYQDMPKNFFTSRPSSVDDLKRISGVGPVLEGTLNDLGIYQFRQVALMSEDDINWVSKHLEQFKGRIERDDWVGQAKELYREKYGKDPED